MERPYLRSPCADERGQHNTEYNSVIRTNKIFTNGTMWVGSKAFCLMKRSRHRRINIVWFCLWGIQRLNKFIETAGRKELTQCLSRFSTVVKKHHDQCNSYKRKNLIGGWITVWEVSTLSPGQRMAAGRQQVLEQQTKATPEGRERETGHGPPPITHFLQQGLCWFE